MVYRDSDCGITETMSGSGSFSIDLGTLGHPLIHLNPQSMLSLIMICVSYHKVQRFIAYRFKHRCSVSRVFRRKIPNRSPANHAAFGLT